MGKEKIVDCTERNNCDYGKYGTCPFISSVYKIKKAEENGEKIELKSCGCSFFENEYGDNIYKPENIDD